MKQPILVASRSVATSIVAPIGSAGAVTATGKCEFQRRSIFTSTLKDEVLEKGGAFRNDTCSTSQSRRGCREPP